MAVRCWVKICGITRIKDAALAYEYGADAIGLVFAKSPRRVYFKEAKKIVLSLPDDIEKVGVFVNPTFEYIKRTIKKSKITMVQLHGSESPVFCKKVKRIIPVIKAVRVRGNENLAVLKPYKEFTLLLDTYSEKTMGGSGKKFNWQFAKKAVKKGYKIILSGGLKPTNICKAIECVKPFGVDVSSGVEKTPGVKDVNKIKNFLTLTQAI